MRPLQVSVFAWDLGRESALQGRVALQVVAQFGDLQHLTGVGPCNNPKSYPFRSSPHTPAPVASSFGHF